MHAVHVPAPAGDVLPAAHAAHVLAMLAPAAAEYLPAAQSVQLEPPDARLLCFPLPHVMHAAALPCKLQRPGLVSFSELRGAVRCGVQQALAYGKR